MASPEQPPSKGKRRRRHGRARAAVAALAVAWLLTLGLLFVAGYRPLVVYSGSMAPTVSTGDLIVTQAVRPADIAVGDVVSFHDRTRARRLVTHRVTETHRAGRRIAFVTRGDVNGGSERWSSDADARIGRLALRIPFAGYAATWLTRLPMTVGLLAISAALFANAVLGARATRSANRALSRSLLAAVVSAAAAVSAPVALGATDGAYSAVVANAANSFQAAASFCNAAPVTVTSSADTYVDQNNPTSNYGTDTSMGVASLPSQNMRSLVKFTLPAPPADPSCSLKSAVLRLSAPASVGAGRTLQAKRITAAWGELTATWNLQPAASNTDVAATPSGGTSVSFDVTAQVLAGATNGFLIRDSVEDQFFGVQAYSTRESAQDPTLVFTYG